ncbi:unnamed protein product [Nippostrongylus brasiliensis]|uniref:BTB domain-containing protein n=1 Tax=Nippostrongylus brasiliensis TaxID=27835 RepID=A0A0N4YMW1_NIPBR|nr:unnamed protein product [Nippostrongylus brasiliensis]
MFREHIAEANKCMFQLKVRDRQTGEELLSPEPCTVIPAPSERTQGFKVPHTSAIGTTLVQLYQASAFAGRICEITTTMSISPAQFRISEWDMLAPSTPLHLDWRFRLLDDKLMYTSKEALYYCSPFFREFFNGQGREADKVEFMDVALEAARTVPNPHPASERLNRGHGGFRTTPHQRVLNAQFSVSCVRGVERVEV